MENVADIYTLSPTQLGMLFHTLADTQAGVYVNQYTCRLSGHLQPELLQQAWQQTLARYPVLRTAFLWDGLDEPLQVVRQQVELPWQVLDWCDLGEQTAKLEEFLECDRNQGFNLDQAPILRLTLIHLNDDTWQFIWSSHHLLFDGWSLPLIWQDMLTYYGALQQDIVPQLLAIRPYRDYIAWQQEQDLSTAESFWRNQLKGFSEPTLLPATQTGSSGHYQQHTQKLSPSLTTALKTFGQQHQLTLNTLVQGAWALLLNHYSSQKQVTYGSVVSGRPADLSGVETMVGMFINTLPVRVDIVSEQPLVDWLQDRQRQLLELRQYEATALTDIQRWSDFPKGSPLFESIVVFENYPTAAVTDLGFETHEIRYLEQSNYPLALLVVPGESLELILLYDSGRFEAKTVENLHAHLELLLKAFVEQPQAKLTDLPRLTAAEQQQLTTGETLDYPRDLTIHQLIEAQVDKTPDAPAVVFQGQTLTYGELNQRAERLAGVLRSHGVAPGERVALCLNPSLERIVSILAVLKAGAAYVPLDPAYPAARLTYCLEDTNPKLLLTQRSVRLPETSVPLAYLDEKHAEALSPPSSVSLAQPDDLAYIIYTSGSTGQPKGVMVSHRNLVHSTMARFQVYPEPVGRFLLLSSIAFDSSVAGIFWTLCQGGTLVLPPERIEQDLYQLATLISQQTITHMLCVPTLYSLLLESANLQQLSKLRMVIVAGEACSRNMAQQHYAKLPATDLYNEYGPTEATVWCTAYRVPVDLEPGPIAIGKAIPNTQVYLLNEDLQPVPIGAVGEIYVGGDGVTRGYLNQPEKTAAVFIVAEDGGQGGGQDGGQCPPYLYKTGDLARYRADGLLEWLGRCDRQVKIRGHRIELGEIEDALREQDLVQEAVVVAQSTSDLDSLMSALAALEPEKAEALLAAIEESA
ncbi:amino acid adenylation domain-containing protein [Leptolyngbya cf. ectocarpi LEGE 11479]|uniref:Amino acid adenylation domain-containing protein n=1 Tax=Leptolyngbya cf. ectocarpi LEGE 11479 TaxID=1828722 RepID=A0A928X0Z1_LEPEC|nr:amino acid adenylation domain-containing protein [Leptolyngbya ectocarpi]MBE9066937.1 amino acid adenylation domain-containing protein [Leptolyngbya cf. ectocarpi LEGE 11479]